MIRPASTTMLMMATAVLALCAGAPVSLAQSTLSQPDEPPSLSKAEKKDHKAARKQLKEETRQLDEEKKQEEAAQDRKRAELGLPDYSYRVDIDGLKKTGLEKLLKDRSDLVRLRKEEPASIWDLRARIRRDITGFADVLRSEGYYGARITYEIDRNSKPIRVAINVDPGERFTIGAYTIELAGPEALPQAVKDEAQAAAQKRVGEPARSETVALAFGEVMAKLPQMGFPRAKLAVQDFKANHKDRKLTAKVRIDTGPKVRFGELKLDGLDTVKPGYVMKAVNWSTGDVYDSRKIDEFRKELTEMNLFASIRIDTDDPLQGDRQPIKVRLREAKHRSIGATASYSTVNGFGGSVFWEHRNMFGAGERLVLELEGDQKLQQFKADLTKPRFLRRKDQKLLLGVEVARENTDAFLEYRGVLRAAVEREVNKRLRVRIGPEVSYLDTRDVFQPSNNVLLGLQTIVNYDHSDNLLDPTTGYRLNGKVTPYLVFGDAKNFVTLEGQASVYFRLDDAGRFVSASRVKVGALFGASDIINIPASKRFYAGGGNSIRGYGYQAIGPKDPLGEPIGGKSVFEVGTEVRIKLTDTWGVVPFFEGGSVFDSQLPDFSRKLRWGAGLGVRYYTGFGPIRLDVAFPINKQPDDNKFQIYVSIGQAF